MAHGGSFNLGGAAARVQPVGVRPRGRILPVGGLTPPFRAGMCGLVQALDRAVTLNHGHAGESFIRHINGWTHADWSAWQKRYSVIRAEMLRRSSSDLVGRVSNYISAIQLAGEIACPLLGLSFVPDMIGAWLMLHLDEQQQNQNLVLLALRALADHYVSNMNLFSGTPFYDQDRSRGLHGAAKPQVYVGFLRDKVDEVFQKRKWNSTAVLNKLAEAGAVHATEGDRCTKKVSVGGVQHRMICVKWSAILPEDLPAVSE